MRNGLSQMQASFNFTCTTSSHNYEGRLNSSDPEQEAEPRNLVYIKFKHYKMI